MKEIQHKSALRTSGVALAVFLVVAAAGAWALSGATTPKPTTVGVAAPIAAAVISPMELMATHGRPLPVTEYAEPF